MTSNFQLVWIVSSKRILVHVKRAKQLASRRWLDVVEVPVDRSWWIYSRKSVSRMAHASTAWFWARPGPRTRLATFNSVGGGLSRRLVGAFRSPLYRKKTRERKEGSRKERERERERRIQRSRGGGRWVRALACLRFWLCGSTIGSDTGPFAWLSRYRGRSRDTHTSRRATVYAQHACFSFRATLVTRLIGLFLRKATTSRRKSRWRTSRNYPFSLAPAFYWTFRL